jgi:hypothetical protein
MYCQIAVRDSTRSGPASIQFGEPGLPAPKSELVQSLNLALQSLEKCVGAVPHDLHADANQNEGR